MSTHRQLTSSSRTGRLLLAAAVALTAAMAGTVPAQAAAADRPSAARVVYEYTAHAFGSQASVGSTARSGKTAYVALGCATAPGVQRSNNTEATDLKVGGVTLGSTGTTVDTVSSALAEKVATSTADSTIQDVRLDGGLVTADVVAAHATTSAAPLVSNGTTSLTDLRVQGTPMPADPAANTKVDLGPAGYVILNEQVRTGHTRSGSITVNAIHLHLIDQTSPGTPIDIIVGQATAGLRPAVSGPLQGKAYATMVTLLDGTIESGATAVQPLACRGTNGQVRSNDIAGVTLPGSSGSVGAATSQAVGKVRAAKTTARTTDTISDVDLPGIVAARLVKAELRGQRIDRGTPTVTDTSRFVGLSVAGTPVSNNPDPNTKMNLPGVGTLYLHRVLQLRNGTTEVRMIELVLTDPAGGLPAGADIRIGVASLGIRS